VSASGTLRGFSASGSNPLAPEDSDVCRCPNRAEPSP